MIKLGVVYLLAGLVFAAFAVLSARDATNPKRWMNTGFWGLFAVSFLAGDGLGDLGNGVLVLCMALISGIGGLGRGEPDGSPEARKLSAEKWGNRLFIPARTATR